MPSRVRAWVFAATRSLLSNLIDPLVALSRPMMLFISVVLPAPLRPISPAMVPVGSCSDTSRKICTDWIETLRFATLSICRAFLLVHPVQLASDHVALDLGVGERDFRRRVGDDASIIKSEHALREAAHHLHVMFDEQHRRALRL